MSSPSLFGEGNRNGPATGLMMGKHTHVRRRIFGQERVRHRQRAELVGLQGNLLSKHNVARDQITDGHKTTTNFRVSSGVDLNSRSSKRHSGYGNAFRCRSR